MNSTSENMSKPETAPKEEEERKETPWKIIIFCTIFVGLFVAVMFWPPAKRLLLQTEDYIEAQGWYGRISLVMFVGFLVVPLGLPYSMFQMLFALVVKKFWLALFLTSLSQSIGAGVAFLLTRYLLREKLRERLHKQKIFRGVEAILAKDPVKFSVVLNLTNIPTLIKNYALAMPDNMSAKVYMSTAILGAVFTSAPQIYVFQEAEEFNQLFDHKRSTLSTAFTVITTLLSILVIIYVMWYTKKLLNHIDVEFKNLKALELQGVALEIKDTAPSTVKSNELSPSKKTDKIKLISQDERKASLDVIEPYLDNLAC